MKQLKQEPANEMFDSKEAAAYLGFSESWLNGKRAKGFGPRFLKIGARIRYTKANLDDYLKTRVRETTESRAAA